MRLIFIVLLCAALCCAAESEKARKMRFVSLNFVLFFLVILR